MNFQVLFFKLLKYTSNRISFVLVKDGLDLFPGRAGSFALNHSDEVFPEIAHSFFYVLESQHCFLLLLQKHLANFKDLFSQALLLWYFLPTLHHHSLRNLFNLCDLLGQLEQHVLLLVLHVHEELEGQLHRSMA